jgi:hypothetical protein
LRARKSVRDQMPAVARPVLGAGLRVGPVRRVLGTLVAVAAPVVALDALLREVTATSIVVSVVTVLGAGWLLALRGVTIRGVRTLAAVPRPATGVKGGGLASLGGGTPVSWMMAGFESPTSSFAIDASDFGGYDGGGSDGGGSDGGGDSGY